MDAEDLSWDWLLEDKLPKIRPNAVKPKKSKKLDRKSVTNRFMLCCTDATDAEIAEALGVVVKTVQRWRKGTSTVRFEYVHYAVDKKAATWEWLLEGRGDPPPGLSERPATTNDSPKGAGG